EHLAVQQGAHVVDVQGVAGGGGGARADDEVLDLKGRDAARVVGQRAGVGAAAARREADEGNDRQTLQETSRVGRNGAFYHRPAARSFAGRISRQVVHQPVLIVATNSAGSRSASISRASRSWS